MRLSLNCAQAPMRVPAYDKLQLSLRAPFPLKDTLPYHYRNQSLAHNIKAQAGIPTGEIAGIETGITPGLIDDTILITASKTHITSETHIQNLASSGSGTQAAPYIIENLDYDGQQSTNWALRFNDPDANYHVKFINCRFYDWTSQNLWFDTWGSGTITFEHCLFYNTAANGELFLQTSGHITLKECELSGCNSYAGYVTATTAQGSLTLTNIYISNNSANWASGCDVFFFNSPNLIINAAHIENQASMTPVTIDSLFQIIACQDGSTFSHIKINGGMAHMMSDIVATAAQKSIIVTYFDIQNTAQEAILLSALNGTTIQHGTVQHNASTGSGYRLIYLISDDTDSTIKIENTTVQYLKMTKQSGSGAGNECLESARAKNTAFRYCYVTECTEDAFEHISVIENCSIEYCVAENCTGQIADFFKQWDESSWSLVTDTNLAIDSQSYCHHIYGDCSNYAVIGTALNGFYFHDIHAINTGSTNLVPIKIEDLDGTAINTVHGAGALPLQHERGNGSSTPAIGQNTATGSDINITYFERENA